MCSFYTQMVIMGNDHGDLADIVLGGGVSTSTGDQWKLASGSTNHRTTSNSFDDLLEDFGNPFTNTRDPLLHEMNVKVDGMALNRPPNSGGEHSFLPYWVFGEDHTNKRSPASNMFSRMLQISPNTSTSPIAAAQPAAVAASLPAINTCQSDVIKAGNNFVGCTSVEDGTGVQIPNPRNPGIKRRKSQAKKVVCIPAPAAASRRPSGEVVPSDLWAWRKYGQKPIKGSPYPRGYYRCSSSKGCSARKQVERSRTDPNMLVITYTSEHNHPWPTQRNALAGSTRSQPLKGNSSSLKNITPLASTSARPSRSLDVKEEQKEIPNHENNSKAVVPSDHHSKLSVKDEVAPTEDEIKPRLELGDHDFDQVFHDTCMPLPLPDPGQPHDDFFADLDELDPDPFSLMYSQGLPRDQTSHEKEGKGKNSKASIDPFMDIYDWSSTGAS